MNVLEIENENETEQLLAEAAISLITKAEIDTQISTARAFPRSIKKFISDVMSLATISEDVAQSCTFALPTAGKTLTGPSVRLAEMAFTCYKNLRGGARVINNDGKVITAQVVMHDLENNVCYTGEVQRSIMQNEYANGRKTGRMVPMSEHMQVVTGSAACSIAFRNGVFKVVPAALIDSVHEQVKLVAMGTEATLQTRKATTFKFLAAHGVSEERAFSALGVDGMEDINLEKLSTLRGMCTLIKNGENTVADIFPATQEPKASGAAMNKKTEDAIKKAAEKSTKAAAAAKKVEKKEDAPTDPGSEKIEPK